jgi:hypothetical protein
MGLGLKKRLRQTISSIFVVTIKQFSKFNHESKEPLNSASYIERFCLIQDNHNRLGLRCRLHQLLAQIHSHSCSVLPNSLWANAGAGSWCGWILDFWFGDIVGGPWGKINFCIGMIYPAKTVCFRVWRSCRDRSICSRCSRDNEGSDYYEIFVKLLKQRKQRERCSPPFFCFRVLL